MMEEGVSVEASQELRGKWNKNQRLSSLELSDEPVIDGLTSQLDRL